MQEIHHKSISVCKHIGEQGCQSANKSVDNYMFVCKQVFKLSQLLLLLWVSYCCCCVSVRTRLMAIGLVFSFSFFLSFSFSSFLSFLSFVSFFLLLLIIVSFFLSFFLASDGQTDRRIDILMSFFNCPRLSVRPREISSSSEHRTWRISSFENNTRRTDRRTNRRTDKPMDILMTGPMDGLTDRPMDWLMDGQTNERLIQMCSRI